jgi:hypothetical protein
MRRRLGVLPLLLILAGLGAAAAPAGAASGFVGFHAPSGNIGCVMDTASVRCDIAQRDWQAPRRPSTCDGDWGNAFQVAARSTRGRGICAGDTTLGSGGTLAYGRSIRRGSLRCTSSEAGIRCTNARHHGFSLSRQRLGLF